MSVRRIVFVAENCIQYHSCESSCKIWRDVEPGVNWRRIEFRWQGSYPQVDNIALSSACRHCSEPACLAACPSGAIEREETQGLILVRREKCIGCKACFKVCPYAVPEFGSDRTMQKCDLCFPVKDQVSTPVCVANCPTKALQIE